MMKKNHVSENQFIWSVKLWRWDGRSRSGKGGVIVCAVDDEEVCSMQTAYLVFRWDFETLEKNFISAVFSIVKREHVIWCDYANASHDAMRIYKMIHYRCELIRMMELGMQSTRRMHWCKKRTFSVHHLFFSVRFLFRLFLPHWFWHNDDSNFVLFFLRAIFFIYFFPQRI